MYVCMYMQDQEHPTCELRIQTIIDRRLGGCQGKYCRTNIIYKSRTLTGGWNNMIVIS